MTLRKMSFPLKVHGAGVRGNGPLEAQALTPTVTQLAEGSEAGY